MADDTAKPAETASAPPAKKPAATAAGDKPRAAKAPVKRSAPRAKPAVARPARKRVPSAAKPAATATRKAAPRKTAAAKAVPAKKPAPTAKPAAAQKAAKPVKAKKVKLVRDSFTMPENEYAVIALLKKRCLGVGVSAKKSEILRAAVAGLAKLSDASVATAIRKLEAIKTGRPAKAAK
jgi:hypothetical protein